MPKALSAFYPLVEPHVYGCPAPMMDQALRRAAREFCRQTGAFQTVETQAVRADTADYDIDVPTGAQLATILGVWYGAAKLDPVATDDVEDATALRGDVGDATADAGEPRCFYQKVPWEPVISLWPVPEDALAAGLTVRASFEPTLSATTVPDLLYDNHGDAIAAGAIGYLADLPGQMFSDAKLARTFWGRFYAFIGGAKATARAGESRRSMRVQHRAFA